MSPKKFIQRVLAYWGLALVRQTTADEFASASWRFGFDFLRDIQKLSKIWGYDVDTILDVGANRGQTTLLAMKAFPTARIFSFEPHPTVFAELVKNIGQNHNVRCLSVALGSEVGEFEMFVYDALELNSMVPNSQFAVRFDKTATRVPVQCTTIDQFCADSLIAQIDVLKIDTEGFELAILRGSSKMLENRKVRFVYVEFNSLEPKPGTFGGALVPINTLLSPYGYQFVATYSDYIISEGEMFLVSNALFALPPSALGLRRQ